MCPGYKEKIISTLTLIGLHDFVCCLIVGTSILKLEWKFSWSTIANQMSNFQSTPSAKIGWVGSAHNKVTDNKVNRWRRSLVTFFKATTDASIRSAFCTVSACAWYNIFCLLFVSSNSVCTIRYSMLICFLRNIKYTQKTALKWLRCSRIL